MENCGQLNENVTKRRTVVLKAETTKRRQKQESEFQCKYNLKVIGTCVNVVSRKKNDEPLRKTVESKRTVPPNPNRMNIFILGLLNRNIIVIDFKRWSLLVFINMKHFDKIYGFLNRLRSYYLFDVSAYRTSLVYAGK